MDFFPFSTLSLLFPALSPSSLPKNPLEKLEKCFFFFLEKAFFNGFFLPFPPSPPLPSLKPAQKILENPVSHGILPFSQ